MMKTSAYVLVSPIRDEEATIGKNHPPVVGQSMTPLEWVICSDGSTDRTDEIIRAAAAEHPWIRLLALEPRPGRSFAVVVHNTEKEIRHLQCDDYTYPGLIDADVNFQHAYY